MLRAGDLPVQVQGVDGVTDTLPLPPAESLLGQLTSYRGQVFGVSSAPENVLDIDLG